MGNFLGGPLLQCEDTRQSVLTRVVLRYQLGQSSAVSTG